MLKKFTILLILALLLNSCGIYKYTDQRNQPSSGIEKAKKNISDGKGIGVSGLIKGARSSTYEFSTSNPMWRASLEILDFIPLATVDYSGGIIITDWYYSEDINNPNKTELKITVRFLNNEIRSDSFKVIVHQRKCKNLNNCTINEIDSKIKEELVKSILTKAAAYQSSKK